jgi:hypothetical protein
VLVQSEPVAKESEIKVRVEPELKSDMEQCAARLGLNLSSYVRFLHAAHKRTEGRSSLTESLQRTEEEK